MAARRTAAQFLSVLQGSSVRSFQPVAVPRQAAVATFGQGRNDHEGVARSSYGGFFSNRQLHKESQAIHDNEDTHDYERSKMTAEGGGSLESDHGEQAAELSQKGEEVKDTVKEETSKAADKAGEVADESKTQVAKNVDTTKDMFKDFPQKVSDTAAGLKEVGVEAAKAVQRDTSKVAQKVGLKNEE